jgi:uncharacterized SAM-binding protein YcdF (DUF218 family)
MIMATFVIKKRNLFVIFSIIALTAVLGIGVFGIRSAGSWLIVSDPVPDKLNMIFTFASESERVGYSKELLSRFTSATWVLSDYKNGFSRILRKDNFDMSKVMTIDTCSSTRSEINVINEWLKSHQNSIGSGSKYSVGLVSSPYHMRRIRMMIHRNIHQKNVTFYYLPVPLDRYNWNPSMFRNWWESEVISKVVISELQKIVYFFLIF